MMTWEMGLAGTSKLLQRHQPTKGTAVGLGHAGLALVCCRLAGISSPVSP